MDAEIFQLNSKCINEIMKIAPNIRKRKALRDNSLVEKPKIRENRLIKKVNRSSHQLSNTDEDDEDVEIARLEKLLGINKAKSKSKSAAKLSEEYEKYEGIGGNFGEFLMELDDLSDRVKGSGQTATYTARDDDSNRDDQDYHDEDHILEDDELEESDIELERSDVISDEESLVSESNPLEEQLNKANDNNQIIEDELNHSSDYYTPAPGEDIYGRIIDSSVKEGSSAKYVPPAKRKLLAYHKEIDENSNAVKMLRKQINGLLNRLSDQSKDSILIGLQTLYKSNSIHITNVILKDTIMSVCSNESQLMSQLIPIYAALIAALHISVSVDVGSFMVEHLTVLLSNSIDNYRLSQNEVVSKFSANYLVLLLYLYIFRIIHHQLITDILTKLTTIPMTEPDIELLLVLIDHGGFQLRSDDPVYLKEMITKVFSMKSDTNNSRMQYMIEALTDLKNNKSRRQQNSRQDMIKSIRKWLGSVKSKRLHVSDPSSNITSSQSGNVLRLSLSDLLNAESNGRWWKAGASWKGNHSQPLSTAKNSDDSNTKPQTIDLKDKKRIGNYINDQKLQKLAEKLRLTTLNRKAILFEIVHSRDLHDAYERISKIDLKGRQDRDVIVVLMECAAAEKLYNPFYTELMTMFCNENRQYKTTLQYAYWDLWKVMKESNEIDDNSMRRYYNLSMVLASMVTGFYLSLGILRVINTSELNDSLKYFLQILFDELFVAKISEDSLQTIFDRIAASTDFDQSRDVILLYLQMNYEPKNNEFKRKKRFVIEILQSMKILDAAKLYSDIRNKSKGNENDMDLEFLP